MFALFLSILIGLAGTVTGTTVAHAEEVDAIVPGSLKLEKLYEQDQPLYVWQAVKLSGQWRIADGTGRKGDTFRIGLPPELEGFSGTFDLMGVSGDPLIYGNCTVGVAEAVCTLNENVEHRINVGGEFWIRGSVAKTIDTSTVDITVSHGRIEQVPLPNGQPGVGFNPFVPSDPYKTGWFVNSSLDEFYWQVVVPSSQLTDVSKITIQDNFKVPGSELTVLPEHLEFFKIPATSECWNANHTPKCRTTLYSAGQAAPGVQVNVDEAADTISATFDNGTNFAAGDIFILNIRVKTDRPTAPGSTFDNTATVNGRGLTSTVTRDASGNGTGAGIPVGQLELNKVVNGTVPGDTVFPVEYSYTVDGQPKSGTLDLKADGSVEALRNLPQGTVVTLTERLPSVPGQVFGDPVFSGAGVTDGGADSPSATVSIQGLNKVSVTLTNTATPIGKVVPVSPTITAGSCPAGATTPTDPTVQVPTTPGIAYSSPRIAVDGNKVTVTLTATAEQGKQIDPAGLPTGWTMNADGTATFTGQITQPDCTRSPVPVTPVTPKVDVNTCPAGSASPMPPKVELPKVTGLAYGDPKIEVNKRKVTVTVTVAPEPGYVIDKDRLGEGWTMNADGTATFSFKGTAPKCSTDDDKKPGLPKTGGDGDVAAFTLAASALLTVGGAALAIGRRK